MRGREIAEALTRWPVKVDVLFYTPKEAEIAAADPLSIVATALKYGRILHQTA